MFTKSGITLVVCLKLVQTQTRPLPNSSVFCTDSLTRLTYGTRYTALVVLQYQLSYDKTERLLPFLTSYIDGTLAHTLLPRSFLTLFMKDAMMEPSTHQATAVSRRTSSTANTAADTAHLVWR